MRLVTSSANSCSRVVTNVTVNNTNRQPEFIYNNGMKIKIMHISSLNHTIVHLRSIGNILVYSDSSSSNDSDSSS